MRSLRRQGRIPGMVRVAALLVPALLAAHACGGQQEPPRPGGPLLALHGEEPSPSARRIEGEEVDLDRRNCLRVKVAPSSLEDGEPGKPTVIVPDGYTFGLKPPQRVVSVVDGKGRTAFRDGGPIAARGGYVEAPLRSVPGIGGPTAEVLESQCPGSYLYLDEVSAERAG